MTDPCVFFLDRVYAEMPQRIHSRDTADDGAPAWAYAFEAYITDGEGHWQTGIREDQDHCNHPTAQSPMP